MLAGVQGKVLPEHEVGRLHTPAGGPVSWRDERILSSIYRLHQAKKVDCDINARRLLATKNELTLKKKRLRLEALWLN